MFQNFLAYEARRSDEQEHPLTRFSRKSVAVELRTHELGYAFAGIR